MPLTGSSLCPLPIPIPNPIPIPGPIPTPDLKDRGPGPDRVKEKARIAEALSGMEDRITHTVHDRISIFKNLDGLGPPEEVIKMGLIVRASRFPESKLKGPRVGLLVHLLSEPQGDLTDEERREAKSILWEEFQNLGIFR